MAEKDYTLTEEGKRKLEEELYELETVRRPEVAERIRVAREFGDISENSEYDDAKNEQAQVESRITEINHILANATMASAQSARSTRVGIGSTVTVIMDDTERVFNIVGSVEADVRSGKISNESPVGSALIGHKVGDTVTTNGPTGRLIEMTIVKLEQK